MRVHGNVDKFADLSAQTGFLEQFTPARSAKRLPVLDSAPREDEIVAPGLLSRHHEESAVEDGHRG